jgi:ATP phosphoribosyltransferase
MSSTSSVDRAPLKLALPKGPTMKRVADLLDRAGLVVPGYHEGSRVYRLVAESPPGVFVKVFSPKDIAIQVAVGNYDVGITESLWVEELAASFKKIAIVTVMELGFGRGRLFAAVPPGVTEADLASRAEQSPIRIVGEYPNLAERFARSMRLFRYRVFPVWGRAASYLPEGADVAVVKAQGKGDIVKQGLEPLSVIAESTAVVVANRDAFRTKDLGGVLLPLREAS